MLKDLFVTIADAGFEINVKSRKVMARGTLSDTTYHCELVKGHLWKRVRELKAVWGDDHA